MAGAHFTGTLAAKNCTSDKVDITHPSGCQTVEGIFKDGGEVGGEAPVVCTQVIAGDSIAPGQTRRWTITLDSKAEPNAQADRPDLPPGAYDAVAGISTTHGVWYAKPVTVTIEGS